MRNLILHTDSYKLTHADEPPPNTQYIYSYLEARVGGRFREIVWFGLQYFLKEYLTGKVVWPAHVLEARDFCRDHFGSSTIFNKKGWEHILEKHNGHLPLNIWALPEGSVVPEGTPLMAVENTDPACWWLTNTVETLLSQVWYPSTVATLSREIKKVLKKGLIATGCKDVPRVLEYMLHDFACRGVTSMESALIGGMGHLLNFSGTDTVPAVIGVCRYYNTHKIVAHSVPASEHSTMTTWGEAGEEQAYANMLRLYPEGIVSIVADSWDLTRAAETMFGGSLRDRILTRNGRTVIRPDSGEPIATNLGLIRILANKFGYTVNEKGYKVLPDKLRILQGDGMNYDSLSAMLAATAADGWAAENWVFGMGGGLMQRGLDRDTQRFAFKCSSAVVDGVRRDVYKRPATDPTKNSKRGLLHQDMKLVFSNGTLTEDTWASVKERAQLL